MMRQLLQLHLPMPLDATISYLAYDGKWDLLKDVHSRIHNTRIDVSEFLKTKSEELDMMYGDMEEYSLAPWAESLKTYEVVA